MLKLNLLTRGLLKKLLIMSGGGALVLSISKSTLFSFFKALKRQFEFMGKIFFYSCICAFASMWVKRSSYRQVKKNVELDFKIWLIMSNFVIAVSS